MTKLPVLTYPYHTYDLFRPEIQPLMNYHQKIIPSVIVIQLG